jgi:hypothetical protein
MVILALPSGELRSIDPQLTSGDAALRSGRATGSGLPELQIYKMAMNIL